MRKKSMKIFKSGKLTVKQPGNSSPSHLTPPLSPPPASPQVSTEWSLGPGETKMAADDGGDGAFVQLQIESGNAQGFCKNADGSFSSVV